MKNSMTIITKSMWIMALSLFLMNTAFAQSNVIKDVKTLSGMEYVVDSENQPSLKSSFTYRDGTVTVIEMMNEYLFPSSIDATGKHVIIQTFGMSEESYYWSQETGVITFPGKGTKVTVEGIIVGDFLNNNFPGGGSAETAGTYDLATEEWTFLGINSDYPTLTSEAYNSGWGQSEDGSIVVGMQMYDGWSATAFKWTEEGGYDNIGDSQSYDSRASGISRNGEVIFGWASTSSGFWTPIVWHNDGYTHLSPGVGGEAMCTSAEGTYVAGKADESAFIWSEEGGLLPFGTYDDYPTIVMEDGSAFGFTGVFPPPIRRAFYKDVDGLMIPFNDYAEARGMDNAQDWIFYSVNDVTPDGNIFIGAGNNPNGQDVSFILDFSGPAQVYMLDLVASPSEGGEVFGAGEFLEGSSVEISAIANPIWAFENWTNEAGEIISTEAETSIIMSAENTILTAHFKSTVGYETINMKDVKIYPNPSHGLFHLDDVVPGSLYYIYDLQGRMVKNGTIKSEKMHIQLKDLKKGSYFIRLTNNDTSIQQMIHLL